MDELSIQVLSLRNLKQTTKFHTWLNVPYLVAEKTEWKLNHTVKLYPTFPNQNQK